MPLLPAHASRRHAACIAREGEGEGEGEGGRERGEEIERESARTRASERERAAAWASLYTSYRVLDTHTA